MDSQNIEQFVSRVMPALIAIQRKIHDNFEDVRYPYLFDSWVPLLKVMTPIQEKTKESVFLLLVEGFEYIHKNSQQQMVSDSISSSSLGCSYDRMVKAIKLFASFGTALLTQLKIRKLM